MNSKKKKLEHQIKEIEKKKIDAIKNQDYAYAAIMRDKEREIMEELRK